METIISYIDNLFSSYPDTPQARKAKEELLGIMEDKYNELKAEGKSEHEAIGIVISEFGSMDEIASELGSDKKITIEKKEMEEHINQKNITSSEALEYLKRQTNFSFKIAIGVVLCILSPVIPGILDAIGKSVIILEAFADAVGGASLFLMVAVAVGIFITAGISNSRYENYDKIEIKLDFSTRDQISKQYEAFNQWFGIKIATGVILCILSVLPPIFLDAFFKAYWINQLSGISIFIFVAAGVFLFITEGMRKDAFEVLLGKGDYAPKTQKQKKAKKIIDLFSSVYWSLVTVVYLLWSIITMKWGFTWIIWPISGIIFSAISTIISNLSHTD